MSVWVHELGLGYCESPPENRTPSFEGCQSGMGGQPGMAWWTVSPRPTHSTDRRASCCGGAEVQGNPLFYPEGLMHRELGVNKIS